MLKPLSVCGFAGRLVNLPPSGGGGNATVPADVPILPPQSFVDVMYEGSKNRVIIGSPMAAPQRIWLFAQYYPSGRDALVLYTQFDGTVLLTADEDGGNPNLINPLFPLLVSLDNESTLHTTNCDNLTDLSAPLLATLDNASDLGASACPLLDAISFPLLSYVRNSSVDFSGCSLLTAPRLPALTTMIGAALLNFIGCGMTESDLDNFFIALAATVITGSGTINASAQSTLAAPSAASSAARTYLTGLGLTIITD